MPLMVALTKSYPVISGTLAAAISPVITVKDVGAPVGVSPFLSTITKEFCAFAIVSPSANASATPILDNAFLAICS